MSKVTSHTEYIVTDRDIMDGIPTLRGTRLPVYIVLEMIEEGFSFDDIRKDYPFLTLAQIRAAVHFAAERVSTAEPAR